MDSDPNPSSHSFLARLRSLLMDYDFEFAEMLTGLAALGWGVWLLNPGWQSFAVTSSFKVMATFAPEWAWGSLMASLGILQLGSLIRDKWHMRRVAALSLTMVWGFISAMFMMANIAGTASVIYPLLSLSSVWAYWRMRLTGRD